MEDETKERVYDVEEDDHLLKPKTITKDNTKDIIKTKTTTNTKAEAKAKSKTEDSICTRTEIDCKECHEEFRNKIALTTHSYSHNRKYLKNTEYFHKKSSRNIREFYITDKSGNYIEDIDDAVNNSLEESKSCNHFRKVKSLKYKITAECEYEKRTKEEDKTTKIFFDTDYIINNAIYENGDFTQWLNNEKEIYEGYGYDFEFLGLRSFR